MDSTTQVQPLRLGTRLEGFEVSRVTDHDPGGYTYVGHEVATKKPVVIREYPPSVAQDLAALAKARHANLAVVVRTFEANNRAYLITEPISGEALSDLLHRENAAFDEARLKSILLPLADGLEAAHVAGVLHLDIQPDHIVVRPNGAPVLVGFGAGPSPTRNPGYSAIEQYSDEFRVGRWTDIYALGAVAYRLLGGQAPQAADQRHAHDEMKPASELGANKYHRSLLQAIDWALKVHPLERPQNLAQWKDALLGLREAAGAGAGATVPITATMIRKFSELRQSKKKEAPAPRKQANVTPVPEPKAESLVQRELEKERLEREKLERERLERERAQKAKAESDRLERERAEREQAERERLEHERALRERAESEKAERAELERLARERREQERLEHERREREFAEEARAERERAEREERERVQREKAERERAERERAEREREERERAKREKAERERAEREERERAERDRVERERAERERERAERERAERERADRERAERERAERERADRERAERERAARAEPQVRVPIVTIPPRLPPKQRPQAQPASTGPSWLSAIGAVLVLVLTIGYWWYNDAREQRRPAPLERVAPATPLPPRSAPERPKAQARTETPPPREQPAPTAPEPAPPPIEERRAEPEAARQPEVAPRPEQEPEPATPEPEETASPTPSKTPPKAARSSPLAPSTGGGQKQLVSQLRKKLTGNWSQESTYSIMAGDKCYAKISRSWNIRFGGTADDGRSLTATFQTKVRAQSAERSECRQFDDQVRIEGAMTARPVSGNTLQVDAVPTHCSGDCDQIADVFNYRTLERRYRFNISADGWLSFSEGEVDFELSGPKR